MITDTDRINFLENQRGSTRWVTCDHPNRRGYTAYPVMGDKSFRETVDEAIRWKKYLVDSEIKRLSGADGLSQDVY